MALIKPGPVLLGFAAISAIQCSPEVEARPCETETLRCSIKPGMDVNKDLAVECVYWDADNTTHVDVFVFREGRVEIHSEDKRFKEFTDLLHKELPPRNSSLPKTFNYSHPGTYNHTVYIKKNNCSTDLTVPAPEQDHVRESSSKSGDGNSIQEKKGSDPGIIAGIIGGGIIIGDIIIGIIIGGIIIIIGIGIAPIAAIILYIEKRPKKNAKETQGTEEEMKKLNGDPDSSESSV